eukprot:TRINITY_DN1374_c0_g1_i2.p1 TRINITY_DN1374_c0_g1~~TRINITY_DN1374_c0_g1_i2.p1  ORF type:complete len:491 (-),score=70.19 TRINITY_DN1374_c0_g1_i2:40-1425(-)
MALLDEPHDPISPIEPAAKRVRTEPSLASFPNEVWLMVMYDLSIPDVRRLARVCRQLAALCRCRDERLWSRLVARLLCRPESKLVLPTFAPSWRDYAHLLCSPPHAAPLETLPKVDELVWHEDFLFSFSSKQFSAFSMPAGGALDATPARQFQPSISFRWADTLPGCLIFVENRFFPNGQKFLFLRVLDPAFKELARFPVPDGYTHQRGSMARIDDRYYIVVGSQLRCVRPPDLFAPPVASTELPLMPGESVVCIAATSDRIAVLLSAVDRDIPELTAVRLLVFDVDLALQHDHNRLHLASSAPSRLWVVGDSFRLMYRAYVDQAEVAKLASRARAAELNCARHERRMMIASQPTAIRGVIFDNNPGAEVRSANIDDYCDTVSSAGLLYRATVKDRCWLTLYAFTADGEQVYVTRWMQRMENEAPTRVLPLPDGRVIVVTSASDQRGATVTSQWLLSPLSQ